ncbi:hypothetical protein B0H11DRAFT_1928141 [Mycena galericulata]|nr:hypothetical protein B0H11DRAFT_1928141 [Mycena galericulata]
MLNVPRAAGYSKEKQGGFADEAQADKGVSIKRVVILPGIPGRNILTHAARGLGTMQAIVSGQLLQRVNFEGRSHVWFRVEPEHTKKEEKASGRVTWRTHGREVAVKIWREIGVRRAVRILGLVTSTGDRNVEGTHLQDYRARLEPANLTEKADLACEMGQDIRCIEYKDISGMSLETLLVCAWKRGRDEVGRAHLFETHEKECRRSTMHGNDESGAGSTGKRGARRGGKGENGQQRMDFEEGGGRVIAAVQVMRAKADMYKQTRRVVGAAWMERRDGAIWAVAAVAEGFGQRWADIRWHRRRGSGSGRDVRQHRRKGAGVWAGSSGCVGGWGWLCVGGVGIGANVGGRLRGGSEVVCSFGRRGAGCGWDVARHRREGAGVLAKCAPAWAGACAGRRSGSESGNDDAAGMIEWRSIGPETFERFNVGDDVDQWARATDERSSHSVKLYKERHPKRGPADTSPSIQALIDKAVAKRLLELPKGKGKPQGKKDGKKSKAGPSKKPPVKTTPKAKAAKKSQGAKPQQKGKGKA